MSAAILREAASLMRENAEAAITYTGEGAWAADGIAWNDNRGQVHMVGCGPVNVADAMSEEVAAHIASWHPAVALAVADQLEAMAAVVEEAEGTPLAIVAAGLAEKSVAVANAYLT